MIGRLGWVPFKADDIRPAKDGFRVMGHRLRAWVSRPLPVGAKICDGGSLAQDARGRWFVNVTIEVAAPEVRENERGEIVCRHFKVPSGEPYPD